MTLTRLLLLVVLLATLSSCDQITSGGACARPEEGRAADATGVVLDASGAPVAGATLKIGSEATQADPSGRFRFPILSSGRKPLSAGRPDQLGPDRGLVDVLPGSNNLRVVIPAGSGDSVVFGRVLDGCTGRPLADATIKYDLTETSTSADGTYVLQPGSQTIDELRVSKSGYHTVKYSRPPRLASGSAEVHDYLLQPR